MISTFAILTFILIAPATSSCTSTSLRNRHITQQVATATAESWNGIGPRPQRVVNLGSGETLFRIRSQVPINGEAQPQWICGPPQGSNGWLYFGPENEAATFRLTPIIDQRGFYKLQVVGYDYHENGSFVSFRAGCGHMKPAWCNADASTFALLPDGTLKDVGNDNRQWYTVQAHHGNGVYLKSAYYDPDVWQPTKLFFDPVQESGSDTEEDETPQPPRRSATQPIRSAPRKPGNNASSGGSSSNMPSAPKVAPKALSGACQICRRTVKDCGACHLHEGLYTCGACRRTAANTPTDDDKMLFTRRTGRIWKSNVTPTPNSGGLKRYGKPINSDGDSNSGGLKRYGKPINNGDSNSARGYSTFFGTVLAIAVMLM